LFIVVVSVGVLSYPSLPARAPRSHHDFLFPSRGPSTTSGTVSEAVHSGGNGQLTPAASARVRYSRTVLCEIPTLRAIARLLCPAATSRSTSMILRMDNRSAAIPPPG